MKKSVLTGKFLALAVHTDNSMVMTGGKGGGGVEEGEGAQMVTEGALTWGVNMQCTDHALQNYT